MGTLTIVFCALALCFFVRAQTVQDDWLFPSKPDLFQTIPIGLTISISWDSNLNSWFSQYAPAATVTNVDLWITDFEDHIFAHQIGTAVDVSHAGTFPWTVEVLSSELSVTNQWVFRFIANNETASSNTGQISSPGFYISNETSASTTTSSTSTSLPQSSTTSSNPKTTAASTTSIQHGAATLGTSASPSTTATISSSLSTGAKVGIAISAVAAAFILVGVGWFLARRRQKQNHNVAAGDHTSRPPPGYGGTAPVHEKGYPTYIGPEIPSYRAELDPGTSGRFSNQRLVEMDGESRARGPP